jgi:hypothetical protein
VSDALEEDEDDDEEPAGGEPEGGEPEGGEPAGGDPEGGGPRDSELFLLLRDHFGSGRPFLFELKNMLERVGITSLEELVKVSTGGPQGTTPGAHLRELLLEVAEPRRRPRVPSAEALDKLSQDAFDKITK